MQVSRSYPILLFLPTLTPDLPSWFTKVIPTEKIHLVSIYREGCIHPRGGGREGNRKLRREGQK